MHFPDIDIDVIQFLMTSPTTAMDEMLRSNADWPLFIILLENGADIDMVINNQKKKKNVGCETPMFFLG